MKNFARSTVIYLLVTAMTVLSVPLTPQFAASQQHVKREAVAFRTQEPSEKLKTEVRTGAAVSLRARQLLFRKKAFAKAYKDMISRGVRPVFEEHGFTILGVDTKKTISYRKSASTAVQDISDGDYEMSFFPFDNGDNSTWEGIVYVRGQYDEATYSVKLDATQEDLSQSEVYYENYYPPEPRDGCGEGRPCLETARLNSSPAIQPVAYRITPASANPNAIMLGRRFRTWLGCSAAGCITAAVGCAFSGPGYLACLGGWCGGSLLGCAVGVLLAG